MSTLFYENHSQCDVFRGFRESLSIADLNYRMATRCQYDAFRRDVESLAKAEGVKVVFRRKWYTKLAGRIEFVGPTLRAEKVREHIINSAVRNDRVSELTVLGPDYY